MKTCNTITLSDLKSSKSEQALLAWFCYLIRQTMKKIYRSRIDLVLLLPVTALLLALLIYSLVEGSLLISLAIVVIVVFLLYVCLTTFYEFTKDKKLKVHSGFLYNREIHINSIRKIKSARNHSASPALSHDRLEIFFNRYGRVLVSPEHRKEFIEELTRINPRIEVGSRM
jgi:hypothetical protein